MKNKEKITNNRDYFATILVESPIAEGGESHAGKP